ncbi:HNH endonuclease [Nitrobacter hamburgensis]|uniref:HNH endonuclease n=1 Tax=Nitrobacter hamburgensis TaxID=912 RepID=UPI0009D660E8|nr:HNH endonuclease signature motif containing protein [Nitrobacter hamburgensis]
MALKQYDRHGASVYRDPRWKAVRYLAKKRDGWRCVKCGFRGRLECDHVRAIRDAPELAFELSNLQTLCRFCHSKKTQIEVGFFTEVDPKRAAWRDLVRALAQPNNEVLNVNQRSNPEASVGNSPTACGARRERQSRRDRDS